MIKHFTVIGVGQIGGVFAQGALRLGARVQAFTRQRPLTSQDQLEPDELIVVSTPEGEHERVFAAIPESLYSHVCLVQNELLLIGAEQLTSANWGMIWFSKKAGTGIDVCGTNAFVGPQAEAFAEVLRASNLEAETVRAAERGRIAAEKYAFILALNALGLLRESSFEKRSLVSEFLAEKALIEDLVKESCRLSALCNHLDDLNTASHRKVSEGLKALAHLPAGGRSSRQRIERGYQRAMSLNQASAFPRLFASL